MLPVLFLGFGALGCTAPPPAVCQTLGSDPLEQPLSFKSYEAAGRTMEEWRRDLAARISLASGSPSVEPNEPTMLGSRFTGEYQWTEFTVQSLIDKADVPYAVVVPSPDVPAKNHYVIILHGHGEDWNAPFEPDSDLRDLGTRLLEEGYGVVSPEIRSFGEFLVDGETHNAYIDGLPEGLFMGQTIADTAAVASAVVRSLRQRGAKISIIGHSFGGYLSMHTGALVQGFTRVMSSGNFQPYGCVNTDYHHADQNLPLMEGFAEPYDTVALQSPNVAVDLFFGGRDLFFTFASLQMYEELVYIFEQTGAVGRPGLYVNEGNGHWVDPEQVLEALSSSP